MSPRSRSQDLTADLLHDLTAENAAPVASPAGAPPPAVAPTSTGAPSPFIETALLLAPRTWARPALSRSGTTLSLSAGPVRVRLGRR